MGKRMKRLRREDFKEYSDEEFEKLKELFEELVGTYYPDGLNYVWELEAMITKALLKINR